MDGEIYNVWKEVTVAIKIVTEDVQERSRGRIVNKDT